MSFCIFTKNQYKEQDCLKGGVWTVRRFKGGGLQRAGLPKRGGVWQERRGGVFERVDSPMHTMQFYIKDY